MRVLVVEDEVSLAETVREGLVGEGFAVDVVHTGPDGLWAATEHPFDVVVLDLLLPGLSGYEVCRRLRERKVWTPVLGVWNTTPSRPGGRMGGRQGRARRPRRCWVAPVRRSHAAVSTCPTRTRR
ncbi:hypothetical protein GCM10022251_79150 [Phytohabitans flavus]|uniref:Response regulatory domain-containing protein n=1 Tax=Phytohabitans flavus TaxID=1076124 RepID=A0A6F8XLV3_9ACTN|nr:hypothetical protein Pflav_011970 [Phytohabitans flavus]